MCTDNAAMIAFAAMLKLENGVSSSVSEEIDPNLALRQGHRAAMSANGAARRPYPI